MENEKILLNPEGKVIIDQNKKMFTINKNSQKSDSMIKITYDELKLLRDNAQLIPGQQYRITDYETTTSQQNTRSAGHQFDIIVVADNESTLNENARACPHDGDTYFGGGATTEKKYTGTFRTGLIPENIIVSYTITIDMDGIYEGELKGGTDKIVELSYKDGTPIFYKNEIEYIESGEEGTDYTDEFTYNGQVEYEGETYDSWKKIEAGKDVGVIIYTNIVVENVEFTEIKKVIPQVADLSAWELKYCLDNDITRFSWASENSIYAKEEELWFYFAGYDEDGKYIWRSPLYWNNALEDSELLSDGVEIGLELTLRVYNRKEGTYETSLINEKIGDIKRGKGVIYYMKDEYGNECSYDFKNIQFLRRAKDFDNSITIDENLEITNAKNKMNIFENLSNLQKLLLKYGLEYSPIYGIDIIDAYYGGDFEAYEELLNNDYICLNDASWNNELYYLINVSKDDYNWFYTFSKQIFLSSHLEDEDTSLKGNSFNNKILNQTTANLPNNIIYYSENNSLINCFDNSFFSGITSHILDDCNQNTAIYSMSENKIFLSNNNVWIGNSDNMYLERCNDNVFNNQIINISGCIGKNNIFENVHDLQISKECNSNNFKNVMCCSVGIGLESSNIEGNNNTIGNNNAFITLSGNSNTIGNNNDDIEIFGSHNIINNDCQSIYFAKYINNNYNIIGNNCANIGSVINRNYELDYCNFGNECDGIAFASVKYNNCVFGEKCQNIHIKVDGYEVSSNVIQNVYFTPMCNFGNATKTIKIEPNLEYITIVKDANSAEMLINEGE